MDSRIKRLEKMVDRQGFLLLICMVFLALDTIAILVLWGQQGAPDFDHIAVSLTVFQTLFGIAALYGFWALRGLTREKAEEVAEAEVRKNLPAMVRREYLAAAKALRVEDRLSDSDIDGIVDAIGEGGKEGDDGE